MIQAWKADTHYCYDAQAVWDYGHDIYAVRHGYHVPYNGACDHILYHGNNVHSMRTSTLAILNAMIQ